MTRRGWSSPGSLGPAALGMTRDDASRFAGQKNGRPFGRPEDGGAGSSARPFDSEP